MAFSLRRAVRDGFRRAGWHVERIRDSFNDQKLLLGYDAKVIFDGGAYNGDTAVKYRKLFPAAEIYCFEPSPNLFKELQATGAKLGKVHAVPLALMDKPGQFNLFEYDLSGYNSMGRCALPFVKVTNECHVSSSTIDDFCTENKVEHVDILKLDIQGSELKALQGAERMLKERRISLIFTEVLFDPEYDQQAYYHEIASFLGKFDYRLFRLYDLGHTTEQALSWGDAIFCTEVIYRSGRLT